jgi:oxygen-independent coproporphyrinogen-3 oxidase
VNPKTLRTIGRGRPGGGTAADDAARSALERLCRDWPGTLSVDLIAGVPGSSPEEAREDVRTVAVSEVDHLSIYALTLEPGTPLHRRICGVRGTSAGGEMTDPATDSWLAAVEEAGARGYRRYEVSNLAKPGAECRHNQRFWEGRPYLGLGPAAVSTLWSSGRPGALRWTRGRRPGELQETERLGYPELLLEYLMLRLRTREGLDMASFAGIFGEQARRELEAASTGARAAGLLRLEGAVPGRLRASDRGYRYLDAVIGGLADGLSLTEACPDDSVKRLPVE